MAGTFVDRVAEIITRYNMAPAGSRLGVAVSGGADSVVLLHLLCRLVDRSSIELSVLHLNHRLRWGESDADEEFVRSLADSYSLPCFAERTRLAPGNLEQAARDARREFFFRLRAQRSLLAVALGHTRSDQAETVLFRFLRGAGTTGLAGMRFKTADGLIRPLLAVSRSEVRAWAAAEGIAWREDATNQDLRFVRNRLRNEVMPNLAQDLNPNLEGVLAHMANVAQGEEDYWEKEISVVYGQIVKPGHLGLLVSWPELDALPVAVQRRLVRRAVKEVRGSLRSIDGQHIEAILALGSSSHGHDRVLTPGIDAIRSFDTLLLTEPGRLAQQERHYSVPLVPGQEHKLPYGAGTISINPANSDDKYCANLRDRSPHTTEIADLEIVTAPEMGERGLLTARNWQPGDEVQLMGQHGPKKVKTLFQEQRTLLWERRHWPVVVLGDEIVWVRGFGSAAKYGSSQRGGGTLRLLYRRAAG